MGALELSAPLLNAAEPYPNAHILYPGTSPVSTPGDAFPSLELSTSSLLFASASSGVLPSPSSFPGTARSSTFGSAMSTLPSVRLAANSSAAGAVTIATPPAASVSIIVVDDVTFAVSHWQPDPPATPHRAAPYAIRGDQSRPPRRPRQGSSQEVVHIPSITVSLESAGQNACVDIDTAVSGVRIAISAEQVQTLACMARMHAAKFQAHGGAAGAARASSCGLIMPGAVKGIVLDTRNFDGAESDDDEEAATAEQAEAEAVGTAAFRGAAAASRVLRQVQTFLGSGRAAPLHSHCFHCRDDADAPRSASAYLLH